MRSSKQRQRNKQNRQTRPSGGNVVNRVFDSSGPEGKVRGTPAQIIEKYLQLHRDAQLSGDRVNAENFAQHAEHYTRILAEAQREIDRAREEQDQWNRDRQAERDRQMEQSRDRQGSDPRGDGQRDGPRHDGQRQEVRADGRPESRLDGRAVEMRDRDRERQARFRAQEEAAQGSVLDGVPGSPAPVAATYEPYAARTRTAEMAEEPGADTPGAAEPSFLRQPLFPVMASDDDAGGSGLMATPEDRQDRQPRPQAVAQADGGPRRGRPRREPREPREPGAEAPQEASITGAAAATAAAAPLDGVQEPKAPRARRPRRPAAAVAPDAAE